MVPAAYHSRNREPGRTFGSASQPETIMTRALASPALLLIATLACSRPLPGPAAVPPDRIVAVDIDGNNIRSNNSTAPVAAEVPVPPASAYHALVAAYEELGLGPESADEASHRVARANLVFRGTLGGQRGSAYFDCGQTLTGPRADEGRLTISVASQATAAEGGATLATTATASVRPRDGTSTGAVSCSSTGRLESLIHRTVRRRLAS